MVLASFDRIVVLALFILDLIFVSAYPSTLDPRYDSPPSPAQPFKQWAALGDAFSSGPGTGAVVALGSSHCEQYAGAYPLQLEKSQLFASKGKQGYDHSHFSFLSCQGSSTRDVQSTQVSNVDNSDIVTLSTGEIDVDFMNVIRQCIYDVHGDCSRAIQQATDLLYGRPFYDNYMSLVKGLLTSLDLDNRSIPTTAIYETSYPQFFEDYTTECSHDTFMPAGIAAPLVSQDVRNNINFFSQQLNYMLSYWVDNVNVNNSKENIYPVRFADPDERYVGHRFCRAGAKEPGTSNKDTYFFHLFDADAKTVPASDYASINASSCSTSAGPEIAPGLECIIAKSIAAGQRAPQNRWPDRKTGALPKVFHPTYAGNTLVADELVQRLSYKADSNNGGPSNKNLRILSVGDSITWGYQSSEGSGYRHPLYELLTNRKNNVTFVGTQTSGQSGSPWEYSEGYPGATVTDIVSHVSSSGALDQKPNLVLVMAGTNDVNRNAPTTFSDLLPALQKLESFVEQLHHLDTTVIVSHIPPIGYEDFGWPLSTTQALAVQWDAWISQMVNRKSAQYPQYRLMKMHTTLTVYDHHVSDDGSGDTLHPSDAGYVKLAYDWAERISDAADFGWI